MQQFSNLMKLFAPAKLMSTANRRRTKSCFRTNSPAISIFRWRKNFPEKRIRRFARHRKTFSDQSKCHVYSQREESTLAALFRMLNLAKMCSLERKSLHRSVAGKIKVHEMRAGKHRRQWIAMDACLHLTLSDIFGFIRAHPQTKVDSTARRGELSHASESFSMLSFHVPIFPPN